VTSGGLKKRAPELREVVVAGGAIDSFRMKELSNFEPVPLGGIEYFCAVTLATFKLESDICGLISGAKSHKSRTRLLAMLAMRFRGFFSQLPHIRAQLYTNVALFLNSFGVDFGSPGRNSMDPTVHLSWAIAASQQQICHETGIRIEGIFDFAHPGGPTGNHLPCMWFARESTYLGKLGGYTNPDRNSQDPLLHMRWALSVNWDKVIKDIKEKYRLQFDRLVQERDRTGLIDFCAESSVRLASWGTECTSTSSPSLDPGHYRSVYHALGDDGARWELLEGQLERLWVILGLAASGYM
jgi:hypothetical protein